MLSRNFLGAALFLVAAAGSVTAVQQLTKQQADQFNAKLNRIVEQGKVKPRATAAAGTPLTTLISDDELNSYFRHNAKDQIPAGIVEPTINAMGEGRLTGRAVVDLDAVRTQKQRGMLDPMGYLTGRVPLTAEGILTTKDGVGQFTLERASLGGISVPKTLIQELLNYYSKTPENPAGINMDAPFELPANIREIRVGKAQATIVQ
jgi:hypothetical protein